MTEKIKKDMIDGNIVNSIVSSQVDLSDPENPILPEFVLKSVYDLAMLNKADIDGGGTTGGVWYQDTILSDLFPTYKQVIRVLGGQMAIEYGNVELDVHRFVVTSVSGLKVKVGSAEYTVFHTGNFNPDSKANTDGSNSSGALAATIYNNHNHANKSVLDSITAQDLIEWDDAVAKSHNAVTLGANSAGIDFNTATQRLQFQNGYQLPTTIKLGEYDESFLMRHSHINKLVLDNLTQSVIDNSHTHGNKALLDSYNQTNANIADAVSLRHSHINKSILDAITAAYTNADKNTLDALAGIQLEADQANALIHVKDGNGNVLSTLNVAFLNNEGTTFNLNQATGRIELLNDQGQVLSSADLQSFIKNMIVNASFHNVNKYQLEFFTSDGSTAFTVPFKIENIQGLQTALDNLSTQLSAKKEDAWIHSFRDFTQGTLIETDIDYSQTQGEEFLLEIKGNTYFDEIPLQAIVQGYIYNDTIISCNGFSSLPAFNNILALNLNGKLHFWFPRLNYWQGFSVKVNAGFGGGGVNRGKQRCLSITNSVDPVGTKRVNIPVQILATRNYTDGYFARQSGYYPSLEVGKADNATKWNNLTFYDIQTNTASYLMVSNGGGIWQYITLGDIRNVLGLQNKANTNGSNTTGGSWKIDYILSDVLTTAVGNGQVLYVRGDGGVDYGSNALNYHRFVGNSIHAFKVHVNNIGDGEIWHSLNFNPNDKADVTYVQSLLEDSKVGGRNLAINSTSLDALPLYGVTGDYEVVNDPTLPSKKFFRLTNITRVAGDYVFYIPFGNLPLNYSYNLANVPLTISFFIRTNNTQYLTGGGIFTNVNNVFKKVEFQYMWGGAGNAHFLLEGAGLSFMEIHSLKIEIGKKATDWTPAIEEQIPDFNQTDATQFNYIKNKPNFADFVSKLNINEDVDGIKRFIGAYVGWLLNGDQNNAWGYLESTNAAFNIGVQLSTKPIDFYNNGIRTARMSQAGLEIFNNIYTTNYGSADLWKIAYDRGDFRDYGLGNTSGVPLPNGNADVLLTNGFYSTGSTWTGSPFAGTHGLNQGYIEHQTWQNQNYALQKFVNVNSEIHYLFRIKDNGVWRDWIRVADRDYVQNAIANIPVHNGQLTVNTTADLVGGYVYLPSGNVTTTLGLATHILNAIADGQAAYNWGNHASAGYTNLGAVQNWVATQGFLTASALNGYVLQSSLTAQLANYATLAGTQTFTGQITFNQAPIVPNGSLGGHTVNLGQMQNYVSTAIANISIPNGQLTFNVTSDFVGGFTYLPNGNITTTLGLATHVLNAIADGQTAYNWGNHATAGYLTLGALNGYATQNWVWTVINSLVIKTRQYDPTDVLNHDYWDKIPINSVRPAFGFDVCNYEPQGQEYVSIFSNYGVPYLNDGILGSIAIMCPQTGVPVIKGTVESQINLNPYINNNEIYFCLRYYRDSLSPSSFSGELLMLSSNDVANYVGSGNVEMFSGVIILGVATRDNTLMVQHREF